MSAVIGDTEKLQLIINALRTWRVDTDKACLDNGWIIIDRIDEILALATERP